MRSRKAPVSDVLLATEGTYPYTLGGVSAWADRLIRGLADQRFTVYAVVANPGATPRYALPENVDRLLMVPLWGTDRHEEFSWNPQMSWNLGARKSFQRDFLPAYEAFLTACLRPAEARLDEALAALRVMAAFAERGNMKYALRHGKTWDILRSRLSEHPLFRHLNLFEAVDIGKLLYRYLAPLAFPVPEARIYHASAAAFCALPLVMAKERHHRPLLVTEHGVYYRERLLSIGRMERAAPYRYFLSSLYGLVVRLVYQAADSVAPVAKFNALWEQKLGVPPERIHPIPNGVDPRAFHITRNPGSGNQPLRLVMIARIDPLKDIHTAIRAMRSLHETYGSRPELVGATLTIYGPAPDPAYEASCRDLVREYRLENVVRFAGPTDDVNGALNSGDIAVMSSSSEGFPYAAVEAVMAGRPIVATNVGGMSEIVQPPYGILVPPRRPRELADAIARLAADRGQLAALGRLGRDRMLAEFTLDRFLDRYRAWYNEWASEGEHGHERRDRETV
ncbi:GT4 family glycosyltransferase PelF [Alicyclobacillus mali (ex Roth et al. 2021)]|uniref:GT4 family glycosyltransferase PelF n=1 Tax=Alicyclobacillus mali (ex Roth et al. 2021) TaxID=1123961 RepID=UPI0023F06725|nr:GT4 family glycosyltransferase PelF [Alicyclobacillus mali (ex Roth et al. 2021)]